MLEAVFDQSRDALKLDISVGDVITPRAVEFGYKTMFDDRTINVWAYILTHENICVGLRPTISKNLSVFSCVSNQQPA
jgi:hypothetical protein